MGNLKTPMVKPLRTQGGTFYTFASAIEDIGLNIAERNNKVRLSHYAILDIPDCNENPTSGDIYTNKFNLYSCPGAMGYKSEEKYQPSSINHEIAQSFMSYALNMETAVINSINYDYSTALTVSERVFWKWLKETGAIRWYKDSSGNLKEGDKNLHNDSLGNTCQCYNNVVKAIGKIDGVSQRSSDYGMYNEIYVNIPSSLGTTEPILFKEVEDVNYSYNKQYLSDTDTLIGHKDLEMINNDTSLYNIGFYDYSLIASAISDNYITNDKNGIWSDEYKNNYIDSDFTNAYIINRKNDNSDNENDKISIDYKINKNNNDFGGTQSNVKYDFLRSKYDCVMLDILLQSPSYNNSSYDELSMSQTSINYNFNTILIYYSIYDNENNILATNLYGVYFIESPENLDYDDNYKLNFKIPRLSKERSTNDGFGTSYSFRLNMRTKSIYDDSNVNIIDNSASENSIVNDFNNVVVNLNKSIELLGRHTKYTHILSNKYNDVENSILNINNDLISLRNDLNKLINQKNDNIDAEFIETDNLSINKTFEIENKNGEVSMSIDNSNVINFDKESIKLNGNINFKDSLLYDTNNSYDELIGDRDFSDILNNIKIVPKSSNNDNEFDLLDLKISNDIDAINTRVNGIIDGKIDIITILAYILNEIRKK